MANVGRLFRSHLPLLGFSLLIGALIFNVIEPELNIPDRVRSGRAVYMINYIRHLAGIKEGVYLLNGASPHNNCDYKERACIWREKSMVFKRSIVIVAIPEGVLYGYSDRALLGLIGHEIGHMARGHIDQGPPSDAVEANFEQIDADRFAANLLGMDIVNAFYWEYWGKPRY